MQKKKTLILLTDYFPFDTYEIFLLHELKYLENNFEKIYILACYATENKLIYSLPENVVAIPFLQNISLLSKIESTRFLFRKEFKHEWNAIRLLYQQQVNFGKIKVMLAYLQSAAILTMRLRKFISINHLSTNELIIYSNLISLIID